MSFLLSAMNNTATTPQNNKMMLKPFGLEGSKHWACWRSYQKVGEHEDEEQHREGDVNQHVPPSANLQVVIAGVDEIVAERRDTEGQVAGKTGRRRSFVHPARHLM